MSTATDLLTCGAVYHRIEQGATSPFRFYFSLTTCVALPRSSRGRTTPHDPKRVGLPTQRLDQVTAGPRAALPPKFSTNDPELVSQQRSALQPASLRARKNPRG